jgi:hypothetical protein
MDGPLSFEAVIFGSQDYIFFEILYKQLENSGCCSFLILISFQLSQGIEKQVLVKFSYPKDYSGIYYV